MWLPFDSHTCAALLRLTPQADHAKRNCVVVPLRNCSLSHAILASRVDTDTVYSRPVSRLADAVVSNRPIKDDNETPYYTSNVHPRFVDFVEPPSTTLCYDHTSAMPMPTQKLRHRSRTKRM